MSVFHYTDINALFSIINNNELWATNSKYLNDKDELLHFYKLGTDAINNFIPEKRLNEIYAKLFKQYFECINENVFILSFCLNNDSFNMWSYFSKVGGVNISINENLLLKKLGYYKYEGKLDQISNFYCTLDSKHINHESKKNDDQHHHQGIGELMFGNVIYNDIEKKELVDAVYCEIRKNPEITYDQIELMTELLVRKSYYFKKQGFSAENEYRIVFQINKQVNEKKYLTSFRVKNNLVVPYLRVKISPKDLFETIRIGPYDNKKDIKESIEDFIKLNEIDCDIVFSDLNIRNT